MDAYTIADEFAIPIDGENYCAVFHKLSEAKEFIDIVHDEIGLEYLGEIDQDALTFNFYVELTTSMWK